MSASNLTNTLNTLLRKHFDKRTSEAERKGAIDLFHRKCKSKGVDPDRFIQQFKLEKDNEYLFESETKKQNQNTNNNSGYSGSTSYQYTKQRQSNNSSHQKDWSSFWDEIFGKGFSGGFRGGHSNTAGGTYYTDEDARRDRERENQARRDRERRQEEERKRQEEARKKREAEERAQAGKYPRNTIRNVKYTCKQAKFSWAYHIDCEQFINGRWIPTQLVIFSDDFEFPKGYRDMLFTYKSNGKVYYGGLLKIDELYFYEEITKHETLIFSSDPLNHMWGSGPKRNGAPYRNGEQEYEEWQGTFTVSHRDVLKSGFSSDDWKQRAKDEVRRALIHEVPDIDKESIQFSSTKIHQDMQSGDTVYIFRMKYKRKKEEEKFYEGYYGQG
jgi:hypothetical protein